MSETTPMNDVILHYFSKVLGCIISCKLQHIRIRVTYVMFRNVNFVKLGFGYKRTVILSSVVNIVICSYEMHLTITNLLKQKYVVIFPGTKLLCRDLYRGIFEFKRGYQKGK
jgi:hypothetical protein